MPSKIQLDENLRFLYTCLLKSDMKYIDFHAVAAATSLKPPAARMRYTRLKRKIESGNFHGKPFMELEVKLEKDSSAPTTKRKRERINTSPFTSTPPPNPNPPTPSPPPTPKPSLEAFYSPTQLKIPKATSQKIKVEDSSRTISLSSGSVPEDEHPLAKIHKGKRSRISFPSSPSSSPPSFTPPGAARPAIGEIFRRNVIFPLPRSNERDPELETESDLQLQERRKWLVAGRSLPLERDFPISRNLQSSSPYTPQPPSPTPFPYQLSRGREFGGRLETGIGMGNLHARPIYDQRFSNSPTSRPDPLGDRKENRIGVGWRDIRTGSGYDGIVVPGIGSMGWLSDVSHATGRWRQASISFRNNDRGGGEH